MKIIYGGGHNKKSQESINNSFIFKFASAIKNAVKRGKKIVFVTIAKLDGHYDSLLFPLYEGLIEIIDSKNIDRAVWRSYDGIFLLGGNEKPLYEGLKKTNFNLKDLKKDTVILGDSAGAFVLSSYFYSLPPGEERIPSKFVLGFNPEAKVITIAHKNNPVYCNQDLVDRVNDFAKTKNIRVLMLEENEQKLFNNGDFINLDKEKLF